MRPELLGALIARYRCCGIDVSFFPSEKTKNMVLGAEDRGKLGRCVGIEIVFVEELSSVYRCTAYACWVHQNLLTTCLEHSFQALHAISILVFTDRLL